jgi:hypothetical protein
VIYIGEHRRIARELIKVNQASLVRDADSPACAESMHFNYVTGQTGVVERDLGTMWCPVARRGPSALPHKWALCAVASRLNSRMRHRPPCPCRVYRKISHGGVYSAMLVGGPAPPMATRLHIRNLLCLSSMFAIQTAKQCRADGTAGRKSYRWDGPQRGPRADPPPSGRRSLGGVDRVEPLLRFYASSASSKRNRSLNDTIHLLVLTNH